MQKNKEKTMRREHMSALTWRSFIVYALLSYGASLPLIGT
jgi:hypothetical protein